MASLVLVAVVLALQLALVQQGLEEVSQQVRQAQSYQVLGPLNYLGLVCRLVLVA